ncbi:hypothetical protein PCC7424_2688 [Gloeothece citriformis PCC 7424]|uniref:Uncharacterized protein n=1 Tax=Gloeothece citriformis (strain PCC 7424) TaxID=65393 RepID=B7KKY1_GLOC7|nr:hypothetical protein [Gloeothece citriformis]ACK71100.1 hypothetical protein PCC7424_2688 [Gloeothece citriformis PCC 7424]
MGVWGEGGVWGGWGVWGVWGEGREGGVWGVSSLLPVALFACCLKPKTLYLTNMRTVLKATMERT